MKSQFVLLVGLSTAGAPVLKFDTSRTFFDKFSKISTYKDVYVSCRLKFFFFFFFFFLLKFSRKFKLFSCLSQP